MTREVKWQDCGNGGTRSLPTAPRWVRLVRGLGVFFGAMMVFGSIVALFVKPDKPPFFTGTGGIIHGIWVCLLILPWKKIRSNVIWLPLFILLTTTGIMISAGAVILFLFLAFESQTMLSDGPWWLGTSVVPPVLFGLVAFLQLPAVLCLKQRYKYIDQQS